VQPHLVYATAPATAPAVELASLSTHADGNWSIQVGAFMSPGAARSAAAEAQQTFPELLSGAAIAAPPTTPFGGAVLYRARLVALSAESAAAACQRLSARGAACMAIPPGR
jgi:outer membrane scaffolding protein for murein synthesis (MipA/OmpV family)